GVRGDPLDQRVLRPATATRDHPHALTPTCDDPGNSDPDRTGPDDDMSCHCALLGDQCSLLGTTIPPSTQKSKSTALSLGRQSLQKTRSFRTFHLLKAAQPTAREALPRQSRPPGTHRRNRRSPAEASRG